MSFEELGDEVRRAVVFADVMNGENVGMIQRRDGASFLLEASQTVNIFRKCFGEDFDGDVAAEARVLRAKHFAHSARANRRDNFVGPYFCAGKKRHGATALYRFACISLHALKGFRKRSACYAGPCRFD